MAGAMVFTRTAIWQIVPSRLPDSMAFRGTTRMFYVHAVSAWLASAAAGVPASEQLLLQTTLRPPETKSASNDSAGQTAFVELGAFLRRLNRTELVARSPQPGPDCCAVCAGHAFCSPHSNKCYAEQLKSYYQQCETPTSLAEHVSGCCESCEGRAFCSPHSGNCYDEKHKHYYKGCDSPVGHVEQEAHCCSLCNGHAFCSPRSGRCYGEKSKSYYQQCEAAAVTPSMPSDSDCCASCGGNGFCSPYSKRCYSERVKNYYQKCDAPPQSCARYGCAEVYIPERSCHCNSYCVQYNSCCEDYEMQCTDAGLRNCRGAYDSSESADVPCLCLFDIDRTLTGKQGALEQCPRNQRVTPSIWDDAYGGGSLVLSAFSVEGISNTFCGRCYTGVVSAGSGSNDEERALITDKILSTEKMRELVKREPSARQWTKGYVPSGGSVQSPFVRNQADRKKQYAVRAVQKWYDSKGICIPDFAVHFFGDRTENMRFFDAYEGFNSREISCGSRDTSILNGMVGLCGARPEEIVEDRGIFNCGDER